MVIANDRVLLRAGLKRPFADGGHDVVASHGDAGHPSASGVDHRLDLAVPARLALTARAAQLLARDALGVLLGESRRLMRGVERAAEEIRVPGLFLRRSRRLHGRG